jgi:hypothetical protein
MAFSTGTVDNIKFGDDFGFFTILHTSDGQPEIFILWFGDRASGGPVALYTMLLTVAAARKLVVEIVHDDNSAFVRQIRMFGQP